MFACQSLTATRTVFRMCPSPSLVHSRDAAFTPRSRTGRFRASRIFVPTTWSGDGADADADPIPKSVAAARTAKREWLIIESIPPVPRKRTEVGIPIYHFDVA